MDGTLMGLPFMVRRIPKFRFMAPEVWRLGCQGPKGHVLPHTLGRWHIYLSPMNDPKVGKSFLKCRINQGTLGCVEHPQDGGNSG